MKLHWTRTVSTLTAAATMAVVLVGCGAGAITASSATSSFASTATSGAPDGSAFASALAGPISTWRTSFQTGSMTFTVPGTVLGSSQGEGPVELVANGESVIGVRPTGVDDAFHIGSMTKLFTAALIMQLDQEGVLSLDATIDTWFPTAPNGSKITVLMLLEHESGLYELDFNMVGTASSQELVDNVFAQTPIAEPGTEYQYLNAGYIILGRIAEEASKKTYQNLVQDRFIEPLGLKGTYLDGYGTGLEAVHGYDLACAGATGSDCLGKPSAPAAIESSPQWKGAWSAGGMVSTAHDQAIWLRDLVAGNVVDPTHKQLMQTLTPLSSQYYNAAYAKAGIPAVQLGEGAGLATWNVPGVGSCLGHAGSIPGSNGIAAYCPEHGLSIAILNTINPAGTTPGYPALIELAPAALQAIGG